MLERRKARRMALEILYEKDILGDTIDDIIRVRNASNRGAPLSDFALTLLHGFERNHEKIDELIAEYADNWSIDRMPIVDRNIIRIGVYEMLFEEAIPIRVSINEAVELAKIFGSEDSSKFVNGILGRIAREMGEEETVATEE
ncbi:MAG: transcription antitermination factor NusB [Actinomycetota bacterium]|nr:transcription antitermination factor NusB [Actinomycetota bacterium]